MTDAIDPARARAAVSGNPLWYHTIEVAPGIATPGVFDLRPVAGRLPWPDVRGKRCLDVGTYDGFLAFELERRGAAEVVATDISDHREWDHEVRLGGQSAELLETIAGEKGAGFTIARELLGSSVEKIEINAYDLTPERVGEFDVVVCGSLLLHLRDPLRALAAIRRPPPGSSPAICSSVAVPFARIAAGQSHSDGWEMSAATISAAPRRSSSNERKPS